MKPGIEKTVRILIADDHELIREGLGEILTRAHPEWEVIAGASNGRQAIELGIKLQPEVAILDLAMPESHGLEVAERLIEGVRGIKIIVVTIHSAEPLMRQARSAGVSGFLAKNEAAAKLVHAVERVLAGEPFFASESASRAPSQLEERERIPVQFLLTAREIDVLRLLAGGASNKEVAAKLQMSVRTVETHRANIMSRLGVDSLAEMLKLAIRDRLI